MPGSVSTQSALAAAPFSPALPVAHRPPASAVLGNLRPIAAVPALRPVAALETTAWLNRPRRMLLALALIWILSFFDLGFTLAESVSGHFVEMNPVAAVLLDEPAYVLTAYKVSLLGLGTTILLSLRRHSVAELGCWFLLSTYFYVAVRWYTYYGCLSGGADNLFVMAPG